MTATTAMRAHRPTPWLRLAQVGWIVLAGVTLALTLASMPPFFAALHHVLPTAETPDFGGQLTASANGSDLIALGLSLDFYARYTVALTLLAWLLFALVGLIIFVRRANDRVALVAAYALILAPVAINADNLHALPSTWNLLILTLQFIGEISLILLFYLFPSGRFAPRWTRWVFILGFVYWAVDIYAPVTVSNSILFFLAFLALQLSLVLAQVARYRSVSTPRERQQTKWVVYGLALGLGGTLLVIIALYVVLPQFFTPGAIHYMVGNALETALVSCLPLSFAVAMLRSQLWEIDVLINRTLVYGLLTGILALIYAGSVALLGGLARGVSGHSDSAPVIVISTLMIAALFQPLRRTLQSGIDRRFYRRKYDASNTIAAFSATLRGNVDLSELQNQLLATVDTTMQPAHVSLWLSPWQRARQDHSPPGS